MGNYIDITGLRFGRLTALYMIRPATGALRWACRCDCGNEIFALSGNLRHGGSRSCGCLQKEEMSARRTTHGDTSSGNGKISPEYRCWCHVKGRTCNPNDSSFYLYGGRGIKMHEPWQNSFETFLNDVGRRPAGKTSLGRIDVNGNYEPGNVRWEDWAEQSVARRNNVWLNVNGQRLTMSQTASALGITIGVAKRRFPLWSE